MGLHECLNYQFPWLLMNLLITWPLVISAVKSVVTDIICIIYLLHKTWTTSQETSNEKLSSLLEAMENHLTSWPVCLLLLWISLVNNLINNIYKIILFALYNLVQILCANNVMDELTN